MALLNEPLLSGPLLDSDRVQAHGDAVGLAEEVQAVLTQVVADEGLVGITEAQESALEGGNLAVLVDEEVGIGEGLEAVAEQVIPDIGLVTIGDDVPDPTTRLSIRIDEIVGLDEDGRFVRGVPLGLPDGETVGIQEATESTTDATILRVVVEDDVGVTEDAELLRRIQLEVDDGVGVAEAVQDELLLAADLSQEVGDQVGLAEEVVRHLTVRTREINDEVGITEAAPAARFSRRVLVVGDNVRVTESALRFWVPTGEPRPLDNMLRRAARVVFSRKLIAVDALLRRPSDYAEGKPIQVMVRWTPRDATREDRRHPKHSVEVVIPRDPEIGVLDLVEGDQLVVPSRPNGPMRQGTVAELISTSRIKYHVRVDF